MPLRVPVVLTPLDHQGPDDRLMLAHGIGGAEDLPISPELVMVVFTAGALYLLFAG